MESYEARRLLTKARGKNEDMQATNTATYAPEAEDLMDGSPLKPSLNGMD
jgi:hypothetical protein